MRVVFCLGKAPTRAAASELSFRAKRDDVEDREMQAAGRKRAAHALGGSRSESSSARAERPACADLRSGYRAAG
jgi:hypothetical protein